MIIFRRCPVVCSLVRISLQKTINSHAVNISRSDANFDDENDDDYGEDNDDNDEDDDDYDS